MINRYTENGETVTKFDYFWKTKVTPEKQEKIEAWLKTLTTGNLVFINILLDDARQAAEWEIEYQHSMED